MKRKIRSLVLLPLSVVALIVSVSLLLSVGKPQIVQGQTAVPTSTVPPTVAPPDSPLPTPPPAAPTPRPVPISDGRVRANGWILEKMVGNRLSSTLYGIAVAPRIYRSNDGGNTWALVQRNPLITDFLMSPADPATLYSTLPIDCTDKTETTTLYRSNNGGVRWVALNQGFDLLPLVTDPVDDDTLIAAGCDGLYRTEDGGWSWSPLSTALEDPVWEEYRAQQLAPAYFAADDEPSLRYLYALVANEEGRTLLLFSEDSGATWTDITPLDANLSFGALTVDLWEVGRVWLSEAGGVWSTEDQGQYWGVSRRGLESAMDRGLTDILLTGEGSLYLGSGLGLYSKEATETRWQRVGNQALQRQQVKSLLHSEEAPTLLWINAANGVYRVVVEP